MTHVTGFVIDFPNHNIVLFGTRTARAAPLRVDDAVVALRNAERKYEVRQSNVLLYSDPGLSIDPDPAVLHKLHQIMAIEDVGTAARDRHLAAWCTTCELPQTVRSMGVPHDTHFVSVMFSADYLLKRVSSGTASIVGLDSLSELTMQRAIDVAMEPSAHDVAIGGLNRFWFTPGATEYSADGATVVLGRADVILRNEAQQLTRAGGIRARGSADPLAQAFACAFSKSYETLAGPDTGYPIFRELENLFRWVALFRIFVDTHAFDQAGYVPDFLLDGYVVPRVPVPHSVKGVAAVRKWDHTDTDAGVKTSLALSSCGGVALEYNDENMRTVPDENRQLPGINAGVFASRPARPVVWWDVRM
jgi:hypothetical protein